MRFRERLAFFVFGCVFVIVGQVVTGLVVPSATAQGGLQDAEFNEVTVRHLKVLDDGGSVRLHLGLVALAPEAKGLLDGAGTSALVQSYYEDGLVAFRHEQSNHEWSHSTTLAIKAPDGVADVATLAGISSGTTAGFLQLWGKKSRVVVKSRNPRPERIFSSESSLNSDSLTITRYLRAPYTNQTVSVTPDSIEVGTTDGRSVLNLRVDAETGDGVMVVQGAHTDSGSIQMSVDGHGGRLNLFTTTGDNRAAIAITSVGSGGIQLWDGSGEPWWSPSVPRPTPVVPSAGVAVESRIEGAFEGWKGETVFKLVNGQIWQQSEYAYKYTYKFRPKVTIYPSGGGHKMIVDGVGTIAVRRIK